MCSPMALAITALATSVAGTGLQVMGQIQQGKAAEQQAKYNAKVQENNAILAEAQAKDALTRGREEERSKRIASAQMEGTQRAAFSANNVALESGSPADVLEYTAAQNELEALTIRNSAEREATGYKARANNYRSGAALSLAEGQNAKKASLYGAGASFLGGASQTASMGFKFKQAGAFD